MADIDKNKEPFFGTLLFVYGTLKRSRLGLHPLLKACDADYLAPASAEGLLYDLGEYPGFYPAEGGGRVRGELYRLNQSGKTFAVLDDYEGCSDTGSGTEFLRVRGKVETESGLEVEAWMYVLSVEPRERRLLKEGVYKR